MKIFPIHPKWTNHRLLADCAWLLPFCFLGYLKVVMSSCHTIFASKETLHKILCQTTLTDLDGILGKNMH